MNTKLRHVGFTAFLLSGICAISCGIVVGLLEERYGFPYSVTGTLLSLMSVGNMAAAFLSGFLPGKIGLRPTMLILSAGYFAGFLLISLSGMTGLLMCAFLMIGLAKGCALNHCTVLVGDNSEDRTRGMSMMHAFYAAGALACPFVINAAGLVSTRAATLTLAALGLAMWGVFFVGESGGMGAEREAVKGSEDKDANDRGFLKDPTFWLLTALVFCQNAAENGVTGWLVTYYKNEQILSGSLSAYTMTVMWGATLMARLLIAFVFPVKNTWRFLAVAGVFCSVFYCALIPAGKALPALFLLFCFSFVIAGVNPVAIAGVGAAMSPESMAVLLPLAGTGAIIMPAVIGFAADALGLRTGMLLNLIPCVMIFIFSVLISRIKKI